MRVVYLIILIVFSSSCSNSSCEDSIPPVTINLEVDRLEQELFGSKSPQDVTSFLQKHKRFSQVFLDADQYPEDSILGNRIFNLIKEPSVDTLYHESLNAFDDFDQIVSLLSHSLGRLKAYYPDTRIPKVQTVVTGLYKDLFISHEQIVIGMDYFIGPDATYKPLNIPDYILKRYTTDHLPAIITRFMSNQYVKSGKGEALITEMIDYGKTYYLLSKLMPCTSEEILIGYTTKELSEVYENDEIIWANFVQNEWFYTTEHSMKQKFLGERPNVYEIGDKCPGRIGIWLGWQIVKSYAEQTGIRVQELMEETDHTKIFMQSGYKPKG